ncbi:hypothetical protein KR009_000890, partial [Drosophila setifemur]
QEEMRVKEHQELELKKQELEQRQEPAPVHQEQELEEQVRFLLGYQLSPQAASAVLASNNREISATINIPDSDDDDDDEARDQPEEEQEQEQLPRSPLFNQRHIPPTRSYRRIDVEFHGTVTDSDSSATDPAESDHEGGADGEPEVEAAEQGENDLDQWPGLENASGEEASDDSSTSTTNEDLRRRYGSFSESTEPNHVQREQIDSAVDKVICKCKPPYSWNCAQEVWQREHNILNRIGWRGGHTSVQSFSRGYYGSRQAVEQLTQLSSLSQHSGCVNCLNFNRSGDLICSGSDDLKIIVWDWANERARHSFRSGHTMNIFQTKFIDCAGCLDIVSASRDGHVRRAVIPPSGGATRPTRLYSHADSVHKLVVVPNSKHEVISAGEDGAVKHFDLRSSTEATTLLRCGSDRPLGGSRVRLFSISHHPFAPEFCISGSDDKLRVYDKRKPSNPIHKMTPQQLKDTKITQITCAVYNHTGSEILASFSDDSIYLFDSRNYKDGETLHCYEGHVNSRTIKGVNFFGPRSEYIVSGSDCGHLFLWDKNTEAIVNYMKGDDVGVVNCLEPHPWMPVLATSGLEHDVKIWAPKGSESTMPKETALRKTLQRNFERNIVDTADFDVNQFQYFMRQFLGASPVPPHMRRRRAERAERGGQQHQPGERQPPGDSSSNSSSNSSNDAESTHHRRGSHSSDDTNEEGNAAAAALDSLHCRTQ